MKIHTIGQTIFNIENLMDGLQTMRQRGKGIVSDSDVYGIKNPISVANIYDNLKNAIERLKSQVKSFDRGYDKVPRDIALTEFIEDYIKHHKYTDFSYDYDSEKHHCQFTLGTVGEIYYDDDGNPVSAEYYPDEYCFKKGDPTEWAKFPPEALTIIFDNIISNARAHGFSGREDGDNKVKIEIEHNDTNYVITIANNGKPLHPQLEEKYVFTYGVTSQTGSDHSGIGAYEVSELMREFGGRAEFISTPNEEYTITYRLIFTDTNIVATF